MRSAVLSIRSRIAAMKASRSACRSMASASNNMAIVCAVCSSISAFTFQSAHSGYELLIFPPIVRVASMMVEGARAAVDHDRLTAVRSRQAVA